MLIKNEYGVSQRYDEALYKFLPTNYDIEAFQAVVTGKYGEVIPSAFDEAANCLRPERLDEIRSQVFCKSEKVISNIFDAYDNFYRWIRIYIEETCNRDKLDGLIFNIKSRFHFVQVRLDSQHPSEKIFESLNTTGRKLSEFDYLRNHLFCVQEGYRVNTPGQMILLVMLSIISTGVLKTNPIVGR